MDYLDELEAQSIYVMREAYKKFKKIGMLWSIGKDSTTMIGIARKAFYGRVPFPVIYIDTGKHFAEMYEFRDKCVEKWGLNLIVSKKSDADEKGIGPKDKIACCDFRKTQALKDTIAEHKFDALILGIRRDEHGVRAKERVFCFPPSTLVYGKDVKPIEKVKKGDMVFTHTGKLRKVLGVSTRSYEGDITQMIPNYGLPILLTPNHPILSKKTTGSGKFIKYKLHGFDGKIHEGKAEITGNASNAWIPASKIKSGDWIFIPKLCQEKNKRERMCIPELVDLGKGAIIEADRIQYKSAHSDHVGIPKTIDLTPEIMRIFGYYIAEGSFSRHSNQLSFAFSIKEKNMITDLIDTMYSTFGVRGSTRVKGGCCEILFSSKTLGRFFTGLCGSGVSEKKLPHFYLNLSTENLRELIRGCWMGDGSQEKYSTISNKLAHQIRIALLSLGILSSIQIKSTKEPKQKIVQIVGHSKKRFKRMFDIKSRVNYVNRFDLVREVKEIPRVKKNGPHPRTGGFWVRVKSVEPKKYMGKLYNLEVEVEKTYLADGISVHNSPRDRDFCWNYKDQAPELWDQYKTKLESEFHLRIHPILSWTELDVWEYIKRENLPVNPLYFAGAREKGKRYRSLGCECCTNPVESRAGNIDEMIAEIKTTKVSERAGRAQDKEGADAMQRLRALGYM